MSDEALDQPVSRYHQISNAIHGATATLAVLAERQTTATAAAERIEKSVQTLMGTTAHLDTRLATLEAQFAPVKNLVYGLVVLIVTGVVGALITLVVQRP